MLYCVIAHAQSDQDSVSGHEHQWENSEYITFLPYDKLDSVLVYANTDLVPIIYKVNKYGLKRNSRLDSIVYVINSILKTEASSKLAYIWIGGSASPEGPLWWNKKLGEYRSSALANFLRRNTMLDNSLLRVENLEEDWYSVTRVLARIDFPHKEQILDIINNEKDREKRKIRIKAIDGGRTWSRLVREIFPPFRNARMVIVCHANEIKHVELKPLLPVAPVSQTILSEIPAPHISMPQIEFNLPPHPETRFLAVKTNTLFLAALTANIGFEAELWRKWSVDIPVWYSPYDITPTRKLRLLAIQPEIRRWTGKAGQGHFFGLHTHIVGFNVAINDNGRFQDPNHALWGMGLSYGYAAHLDRKKRWGLEFTVGAGFAEYDYDVYHNWKNGPKFRSGSDWYYGITRAGVSVSYKWYRERKNKH